MFVARVDRRAPDWVPRRRGLPEVPPPVRPIVEMLPVQMMSLALAALAGREPGKFERITKVTTVE